MSKADKLFKELRLHFILENDEVIKYAEGLVQKEIYFDKINKDITLMDFSVIYDEAVVDFKYIVALNEKIKELGWEDE